MLMHTSLRSALADVFFFNDAASPITSMMQHVSNAVSIGVLYEFLAAWLKQHDRAAGLKPPRLLVSISEKIRHPQLREPNQLDDVSSVANLPGQPLSARLQFHQGASDY